MFVDAGESNPALSLLKNALPLSYAPVPVFPGRQYQKTNNSLPASRR